jgi:hypothetical protein
MKLANGGRILVYPSNSIYFKTLNLYKKGLNSSYIKQFRLRLKNLNDKFRGHLTYRGEFYFILFFEIKQIKPTCFLT